MRLNKDNTSSQHLLLFIILFSNIYYYLLQYKNLCYISRA